MLFKEGLQQIGQYDLYVVHIQHIMCLSSLKISNNRVVFKIPVPELTSRTAKPKYRVPQKNDL